MPDLQMTLYNYSPLWLQNILTALQGYIYKRQRYGKFYYKYLSQLMQRNYSDFPEQRKYQDEQLCQLVNYAVNHSPFYKEFYQNLDMNCIKSVNDIKLLPLLPKETVRQNIDAFYTEKNGIISNTSGTTGTSMKFIYTHEDMQKRMAYLDFFKLQHGFVAFKMKRASFNSAKIVPPKQKSKVFWRDNLSIKQRIYSGYHCKGDNVQFYVQDLDKYQPRALDGYPSAIYEVARYILNNNIVLSFVPVAIFPTAETLLPHYRETIEKAFRCKVRDQYASAEGAPFITECKYGNLHYNMDTGIIEVDDEGEMIVTCFETHGTPLIRYKIGDKITMAKEDFECKCGSCHPIVEKIEGRGLDYLLSRSNGKFTAIYLSLVSQDFMNSVKRMQFIQNNIEEVEILLEVDKNYKAEMNKIIVEKLNYSLGSDMKFNIKIVEEIPKESSGKYRFIKNNLQI